MAGSFKVSTPNISLAQKVFGDPALSCRYFIPLLPFAIPSILASEVSVPFRSIAFGQHQANATTYNFPESFDCPDLTISIPENKQYEVAKGYMQWSDMTIDKDGFFYLPIDYKKDVAIFLLDNAYPKVVKTVLCKNCSPTGMQPHQYSNSGSEALVTELNLKVDRIEVY